MKVEEVSYHSGAVHSAYKGYKKSKIDFLFFGLKLITDS